MVIQFKHTNYLVHIYGHKEIIDLMKKFGKLMGVDF